MQRFTLHSSVFIARSDFFKAARKREWLTDPTKPVDLQDEEPAVFSRYLNCVYVGIEALQIDADAPEDDRDIENEDKDKQKLEPDAFLRSETEHAKVCEEGRILRRKYVKHLDHCSLLLIDLYLLADRLQDMKTANLVMDELIRFSTKGNQALTGDIIRRAYDSTIHGNPLRRYVRDVHVYETGSVDYMDFHVDPGHAEFTRDVVVEVLRLKDPNEHETVKSVYRARRDRGRFVDECYYHQHNETHPRCVPEPEPEPEKEREAPAG